MIAVLLVASGNLFAQVPAAEPFRITDNSFLVEEALNQEPGVFQNIFGGMRMNDSWAAAFTQEWPLFSQSHQFSYTVAFLDDGNENGVGDTLLNYRYQVMLEGPGRPAFSPRVSLVLPSGNSAKGLGSGSIGLQVNLPFSKQRGNWYWHGNGGLTWLPRANATLRQGDLAVVRRDALTSPFLAGSAIYRVRPMFHVMLESVLSFDQSLRERGTARDRTVTLSPGFRGGWNIGDKQVIVGFAVPTSWSDTASTGLFSYFSYELPIRKTN
jgi:hypothetical protein